MGKSLKELLDTFPFENGLNPRGVGPGTLKPQPSDRFTNDNEDAKQWLKATPQLYGTDIVRIMTQTDPHETKKGVKKAADKVGGAIGGGVGKVIGGVVSKIAEFHPKFPDDWTNDADAPTKMENNFYAGLVNGDYARGKYYNAYHKNSKSKLGQFLQANKSPEQVKNAIVPALKSAAVAAAVGLVVLGASKLFGNKNKKKGKEGPEKPTKKEKRNVAFFTKDKFNKPYFPSTLLINEGFGENGYGLSFRNYSRLSQRNGNIGTLNYLEKDGATIIKDMAPTLDVSQFSDIDKEKGISDYYAQIFKNNTPQTRNEGNVIVSATMFQNNYQPANKLDFIDPVNGGTYLTDRSAYASGRSVDDKVQNYSRFVDAEGNAFIAFGQRNADGSFSNNDISKLASLSQRYGANTTNLLSITAAKPDATAKLDTLGDALDPNGNFYAWQSQGATYTKDFVTDRKNSIFATGENYSNEITKDNINVENGGLSQKFGASDTNLLKIVNGANNYTFDLKRDDGSDELIANIKGDNGDNVYTYTESEVAILNVTSEEKSRFITGSIGTNVFLKKGYTSDVETQIGQQFGDAFISVDVDTTNERQYQFPYKKINGMDTVARWNTKAEPFSKNVDEILTNDFAFLDNAIQTQINTSPYINPYLTLKQNILENKEDDIVRVSIGGIRFLATLSNLSDKNTSNWDSVKPVGSGVNFYLFNNWERSITFDLTLYAENDAHLSLIWQKVDDVMALTTGRPSGNKGAAYGVYGNIVNLKLGNLINEIGFVSDISMNVDNSSPWEIDAGNQLPFVCTISVSFQVVTNLEGDEYAFYGKQSANTGAGTAPASNTGPGENTNAAPTNTTTTPKPGITVKPDTRKKIEGTNVPDGTNQANFGFRG